MRDRVGGGEFFSVKIKVKKRNAAATKDCQLTRSAARFLGRQACPCAAVASPRCLPLHVFVVRIDGRFVLALLEQCREGLLDVEFSPCAGRADRVLDRVLNRVLNRVLVLLRPGER